jgi:hypothetical protein
MIQQKWTKENVLEHIKVNVKDYGAAVVVSALYHKLYGELPEIGLSGFQAEAAEGVSELLP